MNGVYSYNKLFDDLYWMGAETLPQLEEAVFAAETMYTTPVDDFEATVDDFWPDFVKDFYS